jgi:hypothetical protein
MNEAKQPENYPPKLLKTATGDIDVSSLANLLEWFLTFDRRVSIMRHPHVEEVFRWKQEDDEKNGIEVYPFENAESRFAIGAFKALGENNSEAKLSGWITEVLQALGEAKQNNEEIAAGYQFDAAASHVAQAETIPNNIERRFYLTNCWFEALCTAEVRFLGWVYQELYGKPFEVKA